jgi:LmbE family N-acetylglucosaminyl deacetylase
MRRVLAIGAHPDDVELGCGGLIQNCYMKRIVVLSNGERGSTLNRVNEAQNAAKILEADLEVYNLLDTAITIQGAVPIIEHEIASYQPNLILTMASNDIHQDHETVFKSTKIAARNYKCTMLSYISPSSAEYFHPTWFVSITEEQMQTKINAIACHISQQHNMYFSREYILGISQYWAIITKSSFPYVEPYEVIQHWE